jgi:hypothetical protein
MFNLSICYYGDYFMYLLVGNKLNSPQAIFTGWQHFFDAASL